MLCNNCHNTLKTSVVDSRLNGKFNYILRRRVCNTCGYAFNTVEIPIGISMRLSKQLELLDLALRIVAMIKKNKHV